MCKIAYLRQGFFAKEIDVPLSATNLRENEKPESKHAAVKISHSFCNNNLIEVEFDEDDC